MLFSAPKLLSFLAALAVVSASTTEKDERTSGFSFSFDRDAEGVHCHQAVQTNGEEDFRLYCINQRQSFQMCALSCSEILHFESSTGVCKSNRCNFYDMSFPMTDGPSLDMNNMSRGKVTMFAFLPLWEGHGQYNYELLELVRTLYPETTEALLLPIDIHDYELTHPRFELKPYGEHKDYMDKGAKQVHILPEVKPQDIGSHRFLKFVQSLLHRSGAANFDVYTDRPAIFVVSSDGTLVDRLVAPTLETLQATVEKYGGGKPISSSSGTNTEVM
jgi:hypothetical protein